MSTPDPSARHPKSELFSEGGDVDVFVPGSKAVAAAVAQIETDRPFTEPNVGEKATRPRRAPSVARLFTQRTNGDGTDRHLRTRKGNEPKRRKTQSHTLL